MKRPKLFIFCAALLCCPWVNAEPFRHNNALSAGAMSIVASPLASTVGGSPVDMSRLAVGGSGLVIVGLSDIAKDLVEVTVEGSTNAGQAVFQVSAQAIKTAGVSVGTALSVVAEPTGHLLVASGKVLAHIPNTIGQALLHQSPME